MTVLGSYDIFHSSWAIMSMFGCAVHRLFRKILRTLLIINEEASNWPAGRTANIFWHSDQMAKSTKKAPRPSTSAGTRRSVENERRLGNHLLWASLALGVFMAILAYLRRASTRIPFEVSPTVIDIRSQTPWKVVDIPGKGKGAIATRFIAAGELMHQERPLLLLPPNVDDEATYLLDQLNALPPNSQVEFYSLANTTATKFGPNSQPEEPDVVHNIFHTNSMLATDGTSSGVFPTAARTNHACRPNAEFYFRDELGALVVHALEDIDQGQEIHYSYFDASAKSRAARREYLSAAYGFECSCPVCSLNTTASAQSDERRAIIAAGALAFEGWEKGSVKPAEAVTALSNALKMMVEERYWTRCAH
jgi:hypothetical protein